MIETTVYKCEYCGLEFDDRYTANCHEEVCRYKDIKKCKGSYLRFYREGGAEIKLDDVAFVWSDFNDVEAFTVGNDMDVKFVKELFDYHFRDNPFCAIEDDAHPNYYGLWC